MTALTTAILAKSPSRYWPMHEDTYGNLTDIVSGSTATGSMINGPTGFTFPAGIDDTAISVATTADDNFIQVGEPSSPSNTAQSFLLFYKDPTGVPGVRYLRRDNSNTGGWLIITDSSGVLTWRSNGTNQTISTLPTGFDLFDGGWHMFLEANTGTHRRLYIASQSSGELVLAAEISGTFSATPSDYFRLGRNGSLSQYSLGIFGHFAWWATTTLSMSDAEDIWEATGYVPPGEPTSLTADNETIDSVDLEWSAPASGPAPTGYHFRIDGGTPVDLGLVTSHVAEGLDDDTEYLFEVRSYIASGLTSGWVGVTATTLNDTTPLPEGVYNVVIDVGIEHETTIIDATLGTPTGGPVLLPLTLGWDLPDAERLLPAQASPTMLKFSLRYADSTLVPALLAEGQPCSFRMFIDDVENPWQAFDGTIVQVDGSFARKSRQEETWDWRVDVYASSVAGLDHPLPPGDYVEEDIVDRLAAIQADDPEVDSVDYPTLTADPETDPDAGLFDAVIAAESNVNSLLTHLRKILQWAVYYDGTSLFGRWVFGHDPHERALRLRVFDRHTIGDDIIDLDGNDVVVEGRWSKLLPDRLPGWGVVDGTVYGAPGTPPEQGVIITTPFQPPSTEVRSNVGNFVLVSDDFVQLDGWRTRALRHFSHVDPEPWRGIFAGDGEPVARLRPVQVSNLDEELRVDGSNYLLGLLAGVTLTIPPGGKHYMTVKLRPELPPGYEPPGDLDPPLDDEEE